MPFSHTKELSSQQILDIEDIARIELDKSELTFNESASSVSSLIPSINSSMEYLATLILVPLSHTKELSS